MGERWTLEKGWGGHFLEYASESVHLNANHVEQSLKIRPFPNKAKRVPLLLRAHPHFVFRTRLDFEYWFRRHPVKKP